MAIQVGQVAPDFTLKSKQGDNVVDVTLSSFRSKNVLLLFNPLAFTGVCTKEYCAISSDLTFYNGLNAEVLAISVDSVFALHAWAKRDGITIPLLSDFNKEVSEMYGCLYETFVHGMKGVSKRSAFVIDKEGIVQYAEVLESAGDLPNFEAIKVTLSELS